METLAPLVAVSLWKHLASAVIRQDIERRFEYFGTVSGVSLYPVKGFGATRVQSARCGPLGLKVKGVRDRYDHLEYRGADLYSTLSTGRAALVLSPVEIKALQ